MNGAHDQVSNGEVAEVTYQAESQAVLSLRILDGQSAGYSFSTSDNGFGASFLLFAAIVLAAYGAIDWLNDGAAVSSTPDDRPSAEGDVDSKSLLTLSSPD